MIFVWSSEGGPLQYIGILLFLLQVLLPNIIYPLFDSDIRPSPYDNSSTSRNHPPPSSHASTTTNIQETTSPTLVATASIFTILIGMALVSFFYKMFRNDGTPNPGTTNGTTDDPTPRDASSSVTIETWIQSVSSRLGVGYNASVALILTGMAVVAIALTEIIMLFFSSTMDPTMLITMLQLGILFWAIPKHLFALNEPQPAQQQPASAPHHHHKSKQISEIITMVQKMPIEEYIPEEYYTTTTTTTNTNDTDTPTISISKLKRMIQIRQKEPTTTMSGLEKSDLIKELQKLRNYDTKCSICYEDYNPENDYIRILPNCKHEFHVECIDQWAYTFASSNADNNPRRPQQQREPSCPLCNTLF